MDADQILEALRRFNINHKEIADAIGRDRTAATRLVGGNRSIKTSELKPLASLVRRYEIEAGESEEVRAVGLERLAVKGNLSDYVAVEVLPAYAGMGGGGTGDGDRSAALLPRVLVEDELRAQPADLLLIDVRGDSMEPDFKQGDQILVDRRDRDPAQPGPFALWDGDAYVVKLLERVPLQRGRYRVFSANPRYSGFEFDDEDESIKIMGRPVWFARRL